MSTTRDMFALHYSRLRVSAYAQSDESFRVVSHVQFGLHNERHLNKNVSNQRFMCELRVGGNNATPCALKM